MKQSLKHRFSQSYSIKTAFLSLFWEKFVFAFCLFLSLRPDQILHIIVNSQRRPGWVYISVCWHYIHTERCKHTTIHTQQEVGWWLSKTGHFASGFSVRQTDRDLCVNDACWEMNAPQWRSQFLYFLLCSLKQPRNTESWIMHWVIKLTCLMRSSQNAKDFMRWLTDANDKWMGCLMSQTPLMFW